MALTAAQIVARACEIAKVPGYTQQAGQYLNMVLSDLCQDYDFQVARRTYYFNMNPGLVAQVGSSVFGSGPYNLPALGANNHARILDTFWPFTSTQLAGLSTALKYA